MVAAETVSVRLSDSRKAGDWSPLFMRLSVWSQSCMVVLKHGRRQQQQSPDHHWLLSVKHPIESLTTQDQWHWKNTQQLRKPVAYLIATPDRPWHATPRGTATEAELETPGVVCIRWKPFTINQHHWIQLVYSKGYNLVQKSYRFQYDRSACRTAAHDMLHAQLELATVA